MKAVEEEEAVALLPAAMVDKQFLVAPVVAPNRSSSGSSFAEVTVVKDRWQPVVLAAVVAAVVVVGAAVVVAAVRLQPCVSAVCSLCGCL